MNKWVKALIIVGVIAGAIGAAFFPFWKSVFLAVEDTVVNPAQLRVFTPEHTAKIYIDGEEKATTTEGSTVIPGIAPGNRIVKIEREASNPNFYIPFEREVYFEQGAEVEIQWASGPTQDASEGVIKYFKKQPLPKESPSVMMVVYPPDATISWDEQTFAEGEYSISVDDDLDHEVVFERAGYETKTLNVSIGNTAREQNLDFVVEVYLYRIPIGDGSN